MKKTVRATLFKEIITEVECEFDEDLDIRIWIPKDIDHLEDLLADFGDNMDFEYEVLD